METETNRCVLRERRYVMKKHLATRLHYDLRLEWNGVLLSWALPMGPDCRTGVIRPAIEMDDHDKKNILFEGVHETGPIMLWDRGTWQPHLEFGDIASCLRKGILRFTLHGERLKGGWMLIRTNKTNGSRPVWMLCKDADAFAENRTHKSVLEEKPNSISTGRTIEEIKQDWIRPKDKHRQQMRFFGEN